MTSTHAIAVVSGGMDSVTLAYHLRSLGYRLTLLSVDYGQRHVRELSCAADAAEMLDADHVIVDLRSVGELLTGSALTDRSVDVPEGHYEAPTMRSTVVPNRNAMILDVATALAVARCAAIVATGVHAGDHAVYPDCRPAFVEAYSAMAQIANEGFTEPGFAVWAPFVELTKADIARMGEALGVPWERTWSCYQGGAVHCGRCGTCVERREAFDLAGVDDPTEYEAVSV